MGYSNRAGLASSDTMLLLPFFFILPYSANYLH